MIPTVDNTLNWRTYDARIGELLVRLAVGPDRPLQVETAELQPPRIQTEANPEDVLSSFGDIHSQSEWSGGEGLLERFRRGGTDADPTRFWSSNGVDVSPTDAGIPDQVRLTATTERVDTISGTVRFATSGTTLWATSGTTLRKSADVLASSPTFADDDPHDSETPTTVEDVAVVGDIPYAALGTNGIHRDDGGWSHWSDVEAVRVWGVLDRIIASNGAELYEAGATTTSTLLYTLPDGDTWTDVVDGAGVILASASSGFVYAFAPDETAELTIVGQSRFLGEQPRALAARSNLVWVAAVAGDELRLWQGRVDGGVIVDLQLLREWSGCGCGAMSASRDRVLIGVNEADSAYLWRLELASGGLFRGHRLDEGHVDDVGSVQGVALAGLDNSGVWRETDVREEYGWLIGPRSDFFRAEDKSWVSGWADVDMTDGGRVELWYATARAAMFDPEHPGWTRLRTYLTSESGVEVGLPDVASRSLAWMVKLHRGSSGSPKVRSVSFRSYPIGGDVTVGMPVDVGDQLERPGRRRLLMSGWGMTMYRRLQDLEHRSAEVEIFRTGDIVRGVVESIATPVPALTPRGSPTQVSYLRLRGRRVPTGERWLASTQAGSLLLSTALRGWEQSSVGDNPAARAATWGEGLWMLVGFSGKVFTSPDGLTWTEQTTPTSQHLHAVVYADGMFVAAGNGGTIITSPDGANWTLQTTPTSEHLQGLTFGDGTWVAVGHSNVALVSTDAATWTQHNLGFSGTQVGESVAFGDGLFVAVGDRSGSSIATSTDGQTWTQRTSPTSFPLTKVTFGDGRWVATAGPLLGGWLHPMLGSDDGETWVELDVPLRDPSSQLQSSGMWDVAHTDGTWVAVGQDLDVGAVLTSVDGVRFAQDDVPQSASLRVVAGSGG